MKAKAAKAGPPSKAFLGGEQGFLDLKLESVETINHNTKKFRFALPNPDDVSGLQIACLSSLAAPKAAYLVIRELMVV